MEEAVREFNMAFDKAIRVGRMNMELFKAMVEFATLRGRKDIAEKLEIAWVGHPACMQ